MRDSTISDHVDAALERGMESRGVSREDAVFLIEEAPLTELLEAAAAIRDHAKGFVAAIRGKSSFRSLISAAITAAIARSGRTRKPEFPHT